MPHSIDWERSGVTWTFWGIVSGEELLAANQSIYGDRRFDLMQYQIVDLTRVERFEVAPDDMIVMAASDRAAAISRPEVLVAVVATDETVVQRSLLYGAESERSPWEQRIFSTVGEARAWVSGA